MSDDGMKAIGQNMIGLYFCIPTRKPKDTVDALYLASKIGFYVSPKKEWF